MTAVSKPLYWSVGVPFNELFWATSTGALTENAANLLYLQKTVVDTASALETFSGGLLTNSVGALAITSNLGIGTSQTSGILNIGTLITREAAGVINIGASGGLHTIVIDTSSLANTNAAPAIAIGTSASVKTIKINNNSNSVHCSSIDLKGASINHIVANSETPITIGDGQTNSVGGLLIGCSAAGNVRTSAPIKIGADSTTTGVITIGASGSSTSMLGSTTVPTLTFPSNLSNAVNSAYLTTNYVPNSTDTTLAGTKTFTSNILATGIGGASAGVGFTFCGSTTSGAVAMCNASVAGTIGLGQAPSRTGSIGIGDGNSCSHTLNVSNGGSFSGTVNIANGASSSGTINLASGAGTTPTSTVNIASGTTSGAVTIGNANSTTALNGSVTLQNPLILGSIPTVNTQLGYLIPNIYPTTTTMINSTDTSILTQSLIAGTWLLSYQFRLVGNPGGLVSIFLVKITAGALMLAGQTNYITESIPSGSSTARSGSVVVKLTTATNVSLSYYVQTAAVISIAGSNTYPNDYTYLQAVRIG